MDYFNYCLTKFRRLDPGGAGSAGGEAMTEAAEKLSEQYGLEASWLIILLSVGELNMAQVPVYLAAKYGWSADKCQSVADAVIEKILVPVLADYEVDQENKFWSDEPTAKTAILTMLRENLLVMLADDTPDETEAVDFNILRFLSADAGWAKTMLSALTANQEKLGKQSWTNAAGYVAPTVANWLADFVEQVGADFNHLAISGYVSGLGSQRQLSNDEKKVLIRLLVLYFNLRFFPRSLSGLDPRHWQIIPYQLAEPDLTKDHAVINPSAVKPSAVDQSPTVAPANLEKSSAENLEQYPPGSLQRLALEEFLRKQAK